MMGKIAQSAFSMIVFFIIVFMFCLVIKISVSIFNITMGLW